MIKDLFFALRPRQWVKNLLIFLPLIFGKRLFIFPDNLKTAIAFSIFSLAASSVYLINDILDLDRDRFHPAKRLRPLASGKIGVRQAFFTALILSALSLALSFILDAGFGRVVAAYLAFNILYTALFKKAVIIDVFCIGVFFLLRVAAGSLIAGVSMSPWIIIMTALLALFLGFTKRRQELKMTGIKAPRYRRVLIEYKPYFIDQMIGVTASSIAVAYMLYTLDARTVGELGTAHLMYSIPFVYYGIFRYLYLIHKIARDGDPTRVLFSDVKTQINLVFWVVTCILVIYFGL
ncbi:MAG: decaprenyl-phosphate phosphoribosyltransferase [Candidatus Omnitrophota bacterium]